jgi:hypothetical protein
MNRPQEVGCNLVVARCHGAVLLQSGKELFDQVSRLVGLAVIASPVAAHAFGRNDHRLSRPLQRPNHPHLGVIGLVGNGRLRLGVLEQQARAFEVMGVGLPSSDGKPGGIA